MSTFVGIIPQFSYNLSLISHVFINFNYLHIGSFSVDFVPSLIDLDI